MAVFEVTPTDYPLRLPHAAVVNAPGQKPEELLNSITIFYTQLANASDNEGLGLCAVIYSLEGEDESTAQLLVERHTGAPKSGSSCIG